MKNIIFISGLVALGLLVYFTGVYTYFIKDEVSEKLPEMMDKNQATEVLKPVVVKSGEFQSVDFIHQGKGKAFIFEYPDGRKILRFEDFEITNGPDLFVYLSKTKNPTGDLASLGDYLDLGRLKGNVGDQNYELSGDLSEYNSVVVWCRQFDVLFPYAVFK